MLTMEAYEIGGCRLVQKIGSGAASEVYLAEQVQLGNRKVAVKVVPKQPEVSPEHDASADPNQLIVREAQMLGRLTHPNILPVYHTGIERGYRFLVMHYAPHGSLAAAIKGQGPHRLKLPASLAFVADIVGQVADALQYTHEQGIIHADVKPGNVLVQIEQGGHWHVLLADFGISQSAETVATGAQVAGTVPYMAPEQFSGQVTPASDQYALGVMAFQLLAGRTPFVGDFLQIIYCHQRVRLPALRALNPAVPSAVEAVIMRALAKRPERRYCDVAQFAQALRAASALEEGTAGAVSPELSATVFVEGGLSESQARRAPITPILTTPAFDSVRQAEPPSIAATRVAEGPAHAGWAERTPASASRAPTGLLPGGGTSSQPADPRRQGSGRQRRPTMLAAVAVLLVAGIAAVGFPTHAAFPRGSSTSGAVPTLGSHLVSAGVPAATSTASTSNGASVEWGGMTMPVLTAPSATHVITTPMVQPTTISTLQPTATATSQPTATATAQPTQSSVSAGSQPVQPPSPTHTPQPVRPQPTSTTPPSTTTDTAQVRSSQTTIS